MTDIVHWPIENDPLSQEDYERIREHLAEKGSWRDVLLVKVLRATRQ